MDSPTTQNYGLIRTAPSVATLQPILTPAIRPDYILIRTVTVALQPTDWTSLDAPGIPGVLNGCDYAGVVIETGCQVTKFRSGDRVAGCSHGANDADPETGAFARFILAKADVQIKIPEGVGFEEAVASASAILVTGLGLHYFLGLKMPVPGKRDGEGVEEEKKTVLVYGGSTSVGSIAVQFARLSGSNVIILCSPKHHPILLSRGIQHIYDHNTPLVGEKIRSETHGAITKVFDTVAVPSSAEICAAAIGPNGGHYVNLFGIECPRQDVKSEFFLAYGVSGEEYVFEGERMAAETGYLEFTKKFIGVAEGLWEEGTFKVHPFTVHGEGLKGALEGMQRMREGRGPSGEKWVFRTEETEWPV